MYFQIREVILWPRRNGFSPRRLPFELGKVNVITGASKTGKSAIIPIIDYCLGSDKCTIPVNTIRDACSWFGIVIQTAGAQWLIARREPGEQKSTGDMFIRRAPIVEVPETVPAPNTSVDKIKIDFNELAGLTSLDFDSEATGAGFLGRPSFRDVIAFCFQPQNIVANPDVLFYKADTNEHRQKLRTIFPYVLGAVTPETLLLQHELQRLRFEFKRKARELDAIRAISLRWVSEIQSKITTAREMGLIQQEPISGSLTDMIRVLREIASAPIVEPRVTASRVENAADEAVALQREEQTTSSDLTHLKRRLSDMKRLRSASDEYRGALEVRRERLQISEWIREIHDTQHQCPVCGSSDDVHHAEIERLFRSLQRIETEAGTLESMPASFDKEYLRIQAEIDRVTEQLEGIRIRREALENWSSEAARQRYASTAAARFVGGLDEAILRYEGLRSDGALSAELGELQGRISELEERLRGRQVRFLLDKAVDRVKDLTSNFIPFLDIERPNDPVVLAPEDLTVKIVGSDREDYLWEIGSGANWLGYHVATILALHSLFLELPHSPVPSFAIFDQPSQVYFPKRLRLGLDVNEDESLYDDEDIVAVKKIFATFSVAVKQFGGRWQAIVLDHAPEDLWREYEDVHLVDEWRRGKKLVPEDWLDN